jgi:hypothetical protein
VRDPERCYGEQIDWVSSVWQLTELTEKALPHKNGYWVDWSKVSREKLYEARDASCMQR